ncbi:hypothetical protein ACFOYU_19565 [Microvirga sp. GCM10011540]|uniref:hypothetical protein n=1 Tax=Microvirga sp. GCM10011540 TaxID=3317338 RepID=UPI00360EE2B8
MASDEELCPGSIEGIHLPVRAWVALQKDNIRSMDRLAAIADQIERLVPGIGPKTARIIREEIARTAPLEGGSG